MLQISQKTFLVGGFLVFFLTSAVLFTLHGRALDPNTTGDWWAARFVDPGNPNSLTFEIENYSQTTEGSYQLLRDGSIQKEANFSAPTNMVSTIRPSSSIQGTARIKIIIKLGEEEQSLSR